MTQPLRAVIYCPDKTLTKMIVYMFEVFGFEAIGITQPEELFAIRERYRPDIVFAYVYYSNVCETLYHNLVRHGVPMIFTSSNYELTAHYAIRYCTFRHVMRFVAMPSSPKEIRGHVDDMMAERRADVAWLNQIYEADTHSGEHDE